MYVCIYTHTHTQSTCMHLYIHRHEHKTTTRCVLHYYIYIYASWEEKSKGSYWPIAYNDNNNSRIGSYTICILVAGNGMLHNNRKQEVAQYHDRIWNWKYFLLLRGCTLNYISLGRKEKITQWPHYKEKHDPLTSWSTFTYCQKVLHVTLWDKKGK